MVALVEQLTTNIGAKVVVAITGHTGGPGPGEIRLHKIR